MQKILEILNYFSKSANSYSKSKILILNIFSALVFMCLIPALMFMGGRITVDLTGDLKIPSLNPGIYIFLMLMGFIIRAWASWAQNRIRLSPLHKPIQKTYCKRSLQIYAKPYHARLNVVLFWAEPFL